MDCFASQVDVKGKIGPTSLKENVCQVSMFFCLHLLVRVFLYCLHWRDSQRNILDQFVLVRMNIPAGV